MINWLEVLSDLDCNEIGRGDFDISPGGNACRDASGMQITDQGFNPPRKIMEICLTGNDGAPCHVLIKALTLHGLTQNDVKSIPAKYKRTS